MLHGLASIILLATITHPKVGQKVNLSEVQNDTTLFNVEGYYFPLQPVEIAGYRLDSFELLQFDYSTRDSQDNVTYVEKASLELPRAKQDMTAFEDDYEAQSVVLSPDTLELVFGNTPIGSVRIAGAFLDRRGRFAWDPHLDPGKTAVLRALLTVTSGGRTVASRRVVFTYWEGD